MTLEILLVLLILIGALALFALEVFTADFVAFAVMALLMGLGLVTPQEGISGFSNPATITVMAMFILSAGLHRTGAIDLLAEKLMHLGRGGEVRQLLLVMMVVGPISAFVNNTAAVAILIPFVIKLARQSNRSPSKLLIPLSYTSQLAGVITLIGTSTNVLTSAISQDLGLGALGMFEFSTVGLIVFGTGVVYLLTVGRFLLPQRPDVAEITERFHLKPFLSEVIVVEHSPLAGKTLAQLGLASKYSVEVLDVIRGGQRLHGSLAERALSAGDILLVRTSAQDLLRLQRERGLELHAEVKFDELRGETSELVEAIIAPGSTLIGSTLREADFRNRIGASALAMSKHGELVRERLADTRMGVGDSLLLKAPRQVFRLLKSDPNFIVTGDLPSAELHRTRKIPLAVGILLGVVALAALNLQPILVAALEGAVLMVLTGCLRVRELHQAIRWDVIFLLAGVIPLGLALENTGGAQLLAGWLAQSAGQFNPLVTLGLFYLMSMLLTTILSNNATVVVLVPIGVATAQQLGLDPKAILLAIMFAASNDFSTPIGYQTNTMVYGVGGYRFLDYTRVGGPLNLILMVVTTLAIAWLWGL